jgi:hypothetical protein
MAYRGDWRIGSGRGIGLENAQEIAVESPFGAPSSSVTTGTLDGVRMTFLPRHGPGHAIPPSEVNYRANIDVLKRCGVTDLVSLSAVGSLREEYAPGHFVCVDQMIDRTEGRARSFSAAAWSPIWRWPIRCARVWRNCWRFRPIVQAAPCIRAAPISPSKARNFRRAPKAGCIADGAPM